MPAHDTAPTARATAVRTMLVAASVLVLLATVRVALGTAALLAVAGMVAVVTGFVALLGVRGRDVARRGRRGAVAVLVLGGAGAFLGGTAFGAPLPDGPAAAPPAPTASPVVPVVAATASAALDALPVRERAAGRAPVRAAWTDVDGNGCRTDQDALRRELTAQVRTGCRVLAGVLADPYTGREVRLDLLSGARSTVRVDRVVSVEDAWRSGASALPRARRVALVNDPQNLLVASRAAVRDRDGRDASRWLPAAAARCAYVARQVAVKRAYGLAVTAPEAAAMREVLVSCPEEPLPPASRPLRVAEPGATCSAARARAVDRAGHGLRCLRLEDGAPLGWHRPA